MRNYEKQTAEYGKDDMDEYDVVVDLMTEVVEDKTCGAVSIRKIFDDYDHYGDATFGDDGSDNFSMNEFISIGAQRPIEPRRLIRQRQLERPRGPRCRSREWRYALQGREDPGHRRLGRLRGPRCRFQQLHDRLLERGEFARFIVHPAEAALPAGSVRS